jgi:hypothetical protein
MEETPNMFENLNNKIRNLGSSEDFASDAWEIMSTQALVIKTLKDFLGDVEECTTDEGAREEAAEVRREVERYLGISSNDNIRLVYDADR